jgi:MFS family permease
MEKVGLFPVLLAAACLTAGLYGALHNQISYTVAPDYFHDRKFRQFQIPEHLHDRRGAALVGWYASWWMGVFIGIPLLVVGLILPGWKAYAVHCLLAFAVVAATALIVGLAALVHATCTIHHPYFRAGQMHDSSYLGGFLGILTGSAYLVVQWLRLRHRR